uniref:hypothetical protein n=1 Tax=Pannonibacter phragmitetus TaxID=121719 RepID=UPI000B965E2A|nr:hypothetical protein [Pannonibacter phragmitetus]
MPCVPYGSRLRAGTARRNDCLLGQLRSLTKQALSSFVIAGLVPAICKPLIWLDPRHKAEDDDGEAEGLSAVWIAFWGNSTFSKFKERSLTIPTVPSRP